jgi:hypothetical protein
MTRRPTKWVTLDALRLLKCASLTWAQKGVT